MAAGINPIIQLLTHFISQCFISILKTSENIYIRKYIIYITYIRLSYKHYCKHYKHTL